MDDSAISEEYLTELRAAVPVPPRFEHASEVSPGPMLHVEGTHSKSPRRCGKDVTQQTALQALERLLTTNLSIILLRSRAEVVESGENIG